MAAVSAFAALASGCGSQPDARSIVADEEHSGDRDGSNLAAGIRQVTHADRA
jgi:hypothetical protein